MKTKAIAITVAAICTSSGVASETRSDMAALVSGVQERCYDPKWGFLGDFSLSQSKTDEIEEKCRAQTALLPTSIFGNADYFEACRSSNERRATAQLLNDHFYYKVQDLIPEGISGFFRASGSGSAEIRRYSTAIGLAGDGDVDAFYVAALSLESCQQIYPRVFITTPGGRNFDLDYQSRFTYIEAEDDFDIWKLKVGGFRDNSVVFYRVED